MASIKFDFSINSKLNRSKDKIDNSSNYKFRDINTSNMILEVDKITGAEKVHVSESSLNKEAIKSALRNLFSFKGGEDVLDPEFGIGPVYQMLYTPFDKHTTEKMLKTLRDIIAKYEPRIKVESIPTTYDEDSNTFSMKINYIIPDLGVYDVYDLILSK